MQYQYDKKPAPSGVLTATEQLSLSQFMGEFSKYLVETTNKPKANHEKYNNKPTAALNSNSAFNHHNNRC